jgi:aryl sulfotransferase
MRSRADTLVPTVRGIFQSTTPFFRQGTSGAGREILSDDELTAYYARTARLAPPDLLSWLHAPGPHPLVP